jgi:DNA polymerase-3 subunit gamma/tau
VADRNQSSSSGGAKAAGYRVLARKYRPEQFGDLIGQDAMVTTLQNAFKTGRIAQAYMLTGVRGVGKTTTARLIARALNYSLTDGPSLDMGAEGEHCRAILESRHVDVIEMDAASHTGIDDVREIIEAVRYKPASARYKVYIIDEVHMLSRQAFNGLLKTLEEPPEHAKFIFATTEVRKVPVTVLSRCQRFDLRRVDIALLASHFRKIADAEGVAIDDDALGLIARVAEGSVRDGLSLLDQAMAHGPDGITLDKIRDMLGLVDKSQVIDLFEQLMSGDAQHALETFAAAYQAGADPAQVLGDLAEFTHLTTRLKVAGKGFDDPAISQVERDRAQELGGRLDMPHLARLWQMLLKGLAEVNQAANPKPAADMVFIRIAHMADLPTPEETIAGLERPKPDDGGSSRQTAPSPSPASAKPAGEARAPEPSEAPGPPAAPSGQPATATAPSVEPPDPAEPVSDNPPAPRLEGFADVVALLGQKRDVRLKQALEHSAHLVAFRTGHIELRLDDNADGKIANELGRKLTQWTGERWIVALSSEPGEDTLAAQAQAVRDVRFAEARDHPLVQAAMATFPDARIEDVRDIFSDSPRPDDNMPDDGDMT